MIKNHKLYGFISVFAAFFAWGSLPLFWQLLFKMSSFTIVSYRVSSSYIFIIFIIMLSGSWKNILKLSEDKKAVIILLLCGLFMGANWFIYIMSLSNNQVLQASMGYYINPLFNAIFGAIFFKEKLNSLQKISMISVCVGVMYVVLIYGKIPYYAISLALTFAVYGALHKLVKYNVLYCMFYELSVLIIPSLICIYLTGNFFSETISMKFIIAFAGIFTAVPLMGFAFGVQRLTLTTVGIIQYISPTCTFLLSIFYFKEVFNKDLLISFIFIWIGVAIYTINTVITLMKNKNC